MKEMHEQKKQVKKQSQAAAVFKRIIHRPTAVLGGVIFIMVLFCAVFGDVLAPYDINEMHMSDKFATPCLKYLMGTDKLGRDLFSRVLVGAKYTLLIAFSSAAISTVLGTLIGSIAGYFGQRVDNIIMRLLDVVQSIPGMILSIVLATVLGLGIIPCIIAIGVGGIAGAARMARANILQIRKNEYIDAAASINCSTLRIILRHLLPNIFSPIIINITSSLAMGIMGASSLSYLGLGVQPPTPEWGAMLSAGKEVLQTYPHVCLMPGLAISITILSLNLLGDGLRDAMDPKLKK